MKKINLYYSTGNQGTGTVPIVSAHTRCLFVVRPFPVVPRLQPNAASRAVAELFPVRWYHLQFGGVGDQLRRGHVTRDAVT